MTDKLIYTKIEEILSETKLALEAEDPTALGWAKQELLRLISQTEKADYQKGWKDGVKHGKFLGKSQTEKETLEKVSKISMGELHFYLEELADSWKGKPEDFDIYMESDKWFEKRLDELKPTGGTK